MLDPSEMCGVGSESEEAKKTCVDCGTSKTPLWRGGPAGPKSLCNACGIRSRKKRRSILGINKEDRKLMTSSKKISNGNGVGSSSSSSNQRLGDNLKQRLMELGKEVLMQRSTVEKQRRKQLREEEQAAVLLMALSYGSSTAVYA